MPLAAMCGDTQAATPELKITAEADTVRCIHRSGCCVVCYMHNILWSSCSVGYTRAPRAQERGHRQWLKRLHQDHKVRVQVRSGRDLRFVLCVVGIHHTRPTHTYTTHAHHARTTDADNTHTHTHTHTSHAFFSSCPNTRLFESIVRGIIPIYLS